MGIQVKARRRLSRRHSAAAQLAPAGDIWMALGVLHSNRSKLEENSEQHENKSNEERSTTPADI